MKVVYRTCCGVDVHKFFLAATIIKNTSGIEPSINVAIASPKWIKAVKGNKDDTKDSKWIGDLFRLGLVPGSYIPCKSIRITSGEETDGKKLPALVRKSKEIRSKFDRNGKKEGSRLAQILSPGFIIDTVYCVVSHVDMKITFMSYFFKKKNLKTLKESTF